MRFLFIFILCVLGVLRGLAQSTTALTNGLVGYFPFNGNTLDESGFGRHGVIYDTNFTRLSVDRFGREGSAVQFFQSVEGQDSPVHGTGIDLSGSSMTLSYWTRGQFGQFGQSWPAHVAIIMGHVPPGTFNPGGSTGRDLEFRYGFEYSGFTFSFFYEGFQTPIALPTNGWTHAVVTYDKNTGRRTLSVNGVRIAENQASYGYSGNSNFWIYGRSGASMDDCRFYNRVLSEAEIRSLYESESHPPGPRGASAVAQVVNGFVVGATMLDGGFGYTNAPSVSITGGGGIGALAQSVISNGVVVGIQVTSAGSGYSGTPSIQIDLPPIPPRRATAMAVLSGGEVASISVQDGGAGYRSAVPAVRIGGGGGSGATATALVSNGTVTGFVITNPGIGYTSTPRVSIASPPFSPELDLQVSRVALSMKVVLGSRYQIESSDGLSEWTPVGDPFVAEDELLIQEFEAGATRRLFRIRQVP
jgi:hypothetical protein